MRDFLTELAGAAAAELEGGVSCGISTLSSTSALVPIAASDARAARLERAASVVDSPHRDAVSRGAPVHLSALRSPCEWPVFAELARGEEVASMVVMPVGIDDRPTVATLTVYSDRPQVGEGRARQRQLERLRDEMSRAVGLAIRLSASERDVWDLEAAIVTRPVIDQAVGVLMLRHGCNADLAFERLRTLSQDTNRKLRVVAQELLEEVGGPLVVPRGFRRG